MRMGGYGMQIDRHDAHTLSVVFPYSRALVAAIKEIPGRMWLASGKKWLIPVEHGDELMAAFPQAAISYDALVLLSEFQDEAVALLVDGFRGAGAVVVELPDGSLTLKRNDGGPIAPLWLDVLAPVAADIKRLGLCVPQAEKATQGAASGSGAGAAVAIRLGDNGRVAQRESMGKSIGEDADNDDAPGN